MIRDLSIACWRLFSDLDLSEARKARFESLHDCFTRELKAGSRPSDPDPQVVVSPCDAIVGAFGAIADTELFQIKGAAIRCSTSSATPLWWRRTATAASSRCG